MITSFSFVLPDSFQKSREVIRFILTREVFREFSSSITTEMDVSVSRKWRSDYQKPTTKLLQSPKVSVKRFTPATPIKVEWRSESQLAALPSNWTSSTSVATPWIKQGKTYHAGMIGLHEEVADCYDWIKPTAAEGRMREKVIREVTGVVKKLYPYANVEVFGSFSTGLYLSSSDIDIVVFGKWPQLPLQTLADAFIQAKLCRFEDVKVVDKAFVPLLKLTMAETGAKVDISFNMVNGLNNVAMIKAYGKTYPFLPPLFLVLKQFLVCRDLNEVYTGGVSSYALILMIVSFLQKHQRDHKLEPNLGVLLLEFFDFYGRLFNYATATICLVNGGSYISKQLMQQRMTHGHSPGMLSIEDPIQPGHDVCRSCYGALSMKQAFEYAFVHLERAVLSNTKDKNPGILHLILGVHPDEVKFRETVNRQW